MNVPDPAEPEPPPPDPPPPAVELEPLLRLLEDILLLYQMASKNGLKWPSKWPPRRDVHSPSVHSLPGLVADLLPLSPVALGAAAVSTAMRPYQRQLLQRGAK